MSRSHTRRRTRKVKIECFVHLSSGGRERLPSVYVSGARPKRQAVIVAKEADGPR